MAVRSKIKLIWTEGIKFNDDNLVSLILFASLWGFFRHRLHETASEANACLPSRTLTERKRIGKKVTYMIWCEGRHPHWFWEYSETNILKIKEKNRRKTFVLAALSVNGKLIDRSYLNTDNTISRVLSTKREKNAASCSQIHSPAALSCHPSFYSFILLSSSFISETEKSFLLHARPDPRCLLLSNRFLLVLERFLVRAHLRLVKTNFLSLLCIQAEN